MRCFVTKRLPEAIAIFSELITGYPDHARVPSALILRAQANTLLGEPAFAAADYEQALSQYSGAIDLYVEEWLGDALRQDFRPIEAVSHYQAAMIAPGQTNQTGLRIKIGRAYMEAGDYERALEQFDQVYAQATDPATKASMNLLAGEALELQGNLDGLHTRYLDSFENYPAAFDSYVGLIRLVEDGVPVDDFQRGLVDYYAGAYQPAVAAFDRVLASTPSAAAYYFRGLSHLGLGSSALALEDMEATTLNYPSASIWPEAMLSKARTEWAWLDRYTAAVDTYLEVADALPLSAAAVEALFAAGRTAERSNDLARAADIWMRLAEEYPVNPLAPDGAFESGIVRYRLGDYPGAELAFKKSLELASTNSPNCEGQSMDRKIVSGGWGSGKCPSRLGSRTRRRSNRLLLAEG